MTAAPKYKKYPVDSGEKSKKTSPEMDKKDVDALKDAISKLMQDPKTIKKAVSIIEEMLKNKK